MALFKIEPSEETPKAVLHSIINRIGDKGLYVVIVFDRKSADFFRETVTRKTYKDFEAKVREKWPVEAKNYSLRHLFRIDPSALSHQIPGIFDTAIHPVHKIEQTIHGIIMNLNDSCEWTREEIADWLETLDNCPKFKVEIDDV